MSATLATTPHDSLATPQRSVLRFITAGSVDDGKSTLIGRLLFDSKGLFSDQIAAIARAKNKRTVGDTIDLSLLTDGLEAEREQGITIDVAYRYFATAVRKFIVADTPGHEQYTRNMVTGASTADCAVVLVDITRVRFDEGAGSGDGRDNAENNASNHATNKALHATLLPQTKRHTAIASKLRLPSVIFAVNKMDLIDFDQCRFDAVRSAVLALAKRLNIETAEVIPVSALAGDNIVSASERTPWYQGPSLLAQLESLPSRQELEASRQSQDQQPMRFPVQWVARHDGHLANDFRGYMGMVHGQAITRGDLIRHWPSGRDTRVTRIILGGQDVERAEPGQCPTLLLADDIDISRGDQFSATDSKHLPVLSKTITADLCWLDEAALHPGRKYWLKHAYRTVAAKIQRIETVLDVHTLDEKSDQQGNEAPSTLQMNDIAVVQLQLASPIIADLYRDNISTGSFILIDSSTNQTAAAGMILDKQA